MNDKQLKWLVGGGASLVVIGIIIVVIVVNTNSSSSSTISTYQNYSSVNTQSDSATNSYA
tara:strand:- start:376 stop:555 length:180 start_codon:yes stop_codon:yes gene_type:complete